MRRALVLLALVPAPLLLHACGANGDTGDELEFGLDAGLLKDAAGDARSDASRDAARDGAASDGGANDGAATDAFTDASADAGTDGGGSAAVDAGPPDAGLPDPCAYPAPCASATSMGSVSGDTGSGFLRATGSTSKWLVVRVTEDDGSIFSHPDIRAKFTLTHDPNTRFDLYVYRSSGTGDRNCSSVTTTGSRSNTTNVANASLSWSDTYGLGGTDDSRNIVLEVRHVSGPCGAARPWYLDVDGNAQ